MTAKLCRQPYCKILSVLLFIICGSAAHAQNWLNSGNSGTNAGNFIGTTDNVDLRIRTNNSQRMVIDSLGNIGINIDTPLTRLHLVSSSSNAQVVMDCYDASRGGVFVGRAAGGTFSSPVAVVKDRVLADFAGAGFTSAGTYTSFNTGRMKIIASENYTSTACGSYIAFLTTTNGTHTVTERWRIDNTGAFTNELADANSSAVLDMKSTNKGLLIPRLTTSQVNAISSPAKGLIVFDSTLRLIKFYDGTVWNSVTTNISGWGFAGNSGITSDNFVGTINNTGLRFRTNNVQRMIIDSLGNVGIGTSAVPSGYSLAVNGMALFNKIQLKSNITWPDYVFDNNYGLLSIPDLEKYINENKHLPDVPSAQTIKDSGLNVEANQVVLLKKIEELTLYVIDQDKKITDQNKKIEELESDAEKLKQLQLQLDELKETLNNKSSQNTQK